MLHRFSPGTLASYHNLKTLHGDSKLPIGVNGCLSIYVGPVTDWQPVQGVPRLSPNTSWDRSQHPGNPLRTSGMNNGWNIRDSNENGSSLV